MTVQKVILQHLTPTSQLQMRLTQFIFTSIYKQKSAMIQLVFFLMFGIFLVYIGLNTINNIVKYQNSDTMIDTQPYSFQANNFVVKYVGANKNNASTEFNKYIYNYNNVVVLNATNDDKETLNNIIQVMKDQSIQFGAYFKEFQANKVTGAVIYSSFDQNILPFYQSINQQYNPSSWIPSIYALPQILIQKIQTISIYCGILLLGFSMMFLNSINLYQQMAINRIDQKITVLYFGGMNKNLYQFIYSAIVFILYEIQIIILLIVFKVAVGSQLNIIFILLTFITLTLSTIQHCTLGALYTFIGKSLQNYQQFGQLILLLISIVPIIIILSVQNIDSSILLVFSGIPPFSMYLGIHSLFLSSYASMNMSDIYFHNDYLFIVNIIQILFISFLSLLIWILQSYQKKVKPQINQYPQLQQKYNYNLFNYNVGTETQDVINQYKFIRKKGTKQKSKSAEPQEQMSLLCKDQLNEETVENGVVEEAVMKTLSGYSSSCGNHQCLNNNFVIINNVCKEYKVKNEIISANNNISLLARPGEILGILGFNGSGKTTLLNEIAMLTRVTSGNIIVGGSSVQWNQKSAAAKLGLCQQQDKGLFDFMTVKQHIDLYRGLAKLPANFDVVEVLELSQHFDKKPQQLSGGWKRRLSLACSLFNNPQFLLLDEITSGISVKAREELWAAIKQFSSEKTIIATTHTLHEAEKYFDRVAFMFQGRVVCIGNVSELLEKVKDYVRIYVHGAIPESFFQQCKNEGIEIQDIPQGDFRIQTIDALCPQEHLSTLFTIMSQLKKDKIITDYSITQQYLDQIFYGLCQEAQRV